jgi:uncharacterized membrane-anchored protein
MKTLRFALLGLLAAAQLAVLAAMIHGRERILREGEVFNFKTRPIDPADPFQGRYVALGFENNFVPLPRGPSTGLRYREPLYATLETGPDGFARFSGWSRERPPSGAYLKTRHLGESRDWSTSATQSVYRGIAIELPFNRYYMDEAKAPRAEAAVRDAARSTNCWAKVRVLNGRAAIEDVFAQGQSLRELAARKK